MTERRFSFFRTEKMSDSIVSVESFQSKKKNRELFSCNFISSKSSIVNKFAKKIEVSLKFLGT